MALGSSMLGRRFAPLSIAAGNVVSGRYVMVVSDTTVVTNEVDGVEVVAGSPCTELNVRNAFNRLINIKHDKRAMLSVRSRRKGNNSAFSVKKEQEGIG